MTKIAHTNFLSYISRQHELSKGFAQKFKTFFHNINFSHFWNYQNTCSKKRSLHSVMKKLKTSAKIKSMMIVKIDLYRIFKNAMKGKFICLLMSNQKVKLPRLPSLV